MQAPSVVEKFPTADKDPISTSLIIFLSTIIIVAFSILKTGYTQNIANHNLQIPLVDHLNDPSLYPKDPLIPVLSHYNTFLWYAVAFIGRLMPLKILLFILFVAERFLLLYAARRLAQAFGGRNIFAETGAMIWFGLAPQPIIGAGTIVLNYFEHTGLAIPFFLLAIAYLYGKEPGKWAVFMAVGFSLNIMYGFYVLAYCFPLLLLDRELRREIKKWLQAALLFLLMSAPIAIFSLNLVSAEAYDKKLWLHIVRLRFPHNLFPATWPRKDLLFFFLMIVIVAATHFSQRQRQKKLNLYAIYWAAVSLFWLLTAYAAPVLRIPGLLSLHPGRGTDIWYGMAAVSVISIYASFLIKSEKSERGFYFFALALALFFYDSLTASGFPLQILLLGSLILFLPPVADLVFQKKFPLGMVILFISVLCFSGLEKFHERCASNHDMRSAIFLKADAELQQIADWSLGNSAKDAVFLINPTLEQFRSLAKRSVFIAWKDGSALLRYKSFAKTLYERFLALGIDLLDPAFLRENAQKIIDRKYSLLRDQDIVDLRKRYQVDYWIVANDFRSDFLAAYHNQKFKILHVMEN